MPAYLPKKAMPRFVLLFISLLSLLIQNSSLAMSSLGSHNFNFNFEAKKANELPTPWEISGDYQLPVIDTKNKVTGKQALYLSTVTSQSTSPQIIIGQSLYSSFTEDTITLEGYLKYNNYDGTGFFNLYLTTFDGEETKHEIKGEGKYTELKLHSSVMWQKFQLSLPISQDVIYVNLGGVLLGRGQVWLDDIDITLSSDGSKLESTNEVSKILFNQQIDLKKF